MFKFENSTDQNYFNSPRETITVTTEAVTLDEILQSFERFLHGCGFTFDGVLDIVADEPPEEQGEDQTNEVVAPLGAVGSNYKFDETPGANGPTGT